MQVYPLGGRSSHSQYCWPDRTLAVLQANTTAVILANKAMNHVEGGWPKEVDCSEAEHVIRYRKKVCTRSPQAPCSSLTLCRCVAPLAQEPQSRI